MTNQDPRDEVVDRAALTVAGTVTNPSSANPARSDESIVVTPAETPEPPTMRLGLILVLVFLTFGASMAVVAPLSFSLAVKLEILVPGRVDVLGVITAVGAVFSIVATPLVGVLSDRTRSRLGRRRPWVIAGGIIGLIGLTGLAAAPNVFLLGVAWVVTLVSWQVSTNMVISIMGDRLPELQRGRIAAINGMANNVAPIVGIGLVSAFTSNLFLLFLVPGFVAALGVVLFAIFAKDVAVEKTPEGGFSSVLRNMVFDPRQVPDFAWNWLGRFALFLGLSFSSTYGTYFFAARLGLPVVEVGGIIALSGAGGVVLGILGAVGAGFLSDRFRRRKVFVIISGAIMLAGGLISAFSYDMVGLIIGSLLATFAIGSFSAVDQAIVLDVVPDRAESGRYIALMQVAQQIPTAIGPLVAVGLLAIAAADGPNYTLLYIAFGALAMIGALIIIFKVKGVR